SPAVVSFLFQCSWSHADLHSFPTRRSSDLAEICEFRGYRLDLVRRRLLDPRGAPVALMPKAVETLAYLVTHAGETVGKEELLEADRKSTRLNSSHVKISYAVFCLKKKKTHS